MNISLLPELSAARAHQLIDAVIKRDRINLADYDKTVTGMGKWPYEKGPTFSWWTMMGIGIFYYNKSMFDREGQKYPDDSWTWDQARASMGGK